MTSRTQNGQYYTEWPVAHRMTGSTQNQVTANVSGQRQAGRIVAATIQKDRRVPVITLSLTRPCFADYGALKNKSYKKYPQSTCLIYWPLQLSSLETICYQNVGLYSIKGRLGIQVSWLPVCRNWLKSYTLSLETVTNSRHQRTTLNQQNTRNVPYTFILQYHNEHSYMFRSAWYHHQGIK